MKIKCKLIVATRWIWGIICLLLCLDLFSKLYILAGLLFLLLGILAIPLFDLVIENKLHLHMSIPFRLLVITILFAGSGIVLPNNVSTHTNSDVNMITNNTQTPDGKPVTECFISTPYSPDKDSWIKEYAQQHHTNSNPEMFLFTFSNGKQFEYDYTGVGSYNQGMLLPGNWTEKPNESLKPTKISEQQFEQNMNNIITMWSGSSYKWLSDKTSGEVLQVYIGQKNAAGVGNDVEASILKNYIDLKPDQTAYEVIIVIPAAIEGSNSCHTLVFTPGNYQLVELETVTGIGGYYNI
jgi:hypothetical protein